MASYSKRYVAFLDILGFKDLVGLSCIDKPPISVDEICAILDLPEPADEGQILLGRVGDISNSDHRSTAFSDSILITTAATDQGLMHLLHHVAKIGFYLAKLGVLYRGGITRGLAYHDEQHAFGPAIIEAYSIEQNAIFPRVLLSNTVVEAGKSAAEPVNTIFSRLVHTDSDEGVFVNYLRVLRAAADADSAMPQDLIELQNRVRRNIEKQLQRFPAGTKERVKWVWFRSYFDWATDDSLKRMLNFPFSPGLI